MTLSVKRPRRGRLPRQKARPEGDEVKPKPVEINGRSGLLCERPVGPSGANAP
jgi:hypothetical protein